MVCEGLEVYGNVDLGIVHYLAFPNTCYYYFWAIMLAGIFLTLSLILYNREREESIKGDLISSMGVSALATIIIALPATLTTPQIIQRDIFLFTLAFGIIFIGMWIFKK